MCFLPLFYSSRIRELIMITEMKIIVKPLINYQPPYINHQRAKHESSALSSGWGAILNSTAGGLSTAALNIMVLSLFNRFKQHIKHPLHLFALFLLEMATFDFETTGEMGEIERG
jgi:hypothetical protein